MVFAHTHSHTCVHFFFLYLEEIHSLQGNQGSSLITLAFNILNAGTKKFILQ